MKVNLVKTCVIIFFSTISVIGFGQGCSDAGICTLESIKPNADFRGGQNQFRVGIGYGNADHGITVMSPYIAYTLKFDHLSLETRLTSISQSGNETSTFGLSDLFLIGNYRITESLQATLGVKLPLSKSDNKLDGLPLPMDYQVSLGTMDLLVGANYSISKLLLAFAYQQPLSQNSNSFLINDYPSDSEFRNFQSTNNYIRKGDILLRISYPISLSDGFRMTPSILPIYHLGNDSYTDLFAQEQEISGSLGLTLNVNIYLDYQLNSTNSLQFNLGFPAVVRESRPDGLTRHFIANLEYRIAF